MRSETRAPFSPDVLRIGDEWRQNAVVTGQCFEKIKPPHYIFGFDKPRWMRDAEDHIVVAKVLPTHLAVTEKIASELGRELSFPVPPGLIWQQPEFERIDAFLMNYVSLRPFPDSKQMPPPEVLKVSSVFRLAPLFHQLVNNEDCTPRNVIFSPSAPDTDPALACVDFRESMFGANRRDVVVPFYAHFAKKEHRYRTLVTGLQKNYFAAPDVENFMGQIEKIPTRVFEDIVRPFAPLLKSPPDGTKPQDAEAFIETLCYRRDNLRSLMHESVDQYRRFSPL